MILRKLKNRLKNYIIEILNKELVNYNQKLKKGIKDYSVFNLFEGSSISDKSKIYSPHRVVGSKIDNYTYVARNSIINFTDIGSFCSIGPNFLCGYGIHPIDGISTSPVFYSSKEQVGFTFCKEDKIVENKKIVIGNDVFIGMNVTVLDGVKIGDGAIVAAGSVVVEDVPCYSVIGGVPAKIIKYRFDEKTIEKLIKLKWWDFDEIKLKKLEENFWDIDQCINIH